MKTTEITLNKELTNNFDEFTAYVKEHILEFLSEDFKDSEIEVSTINKSNGYSYVGLQIRRANDADCGIIPVLNLTEAFLNLTKGMCIEEVCEKLADIRMNAPMPGNLNRNSFTNFEMIRDSIYPRLLNGRDPRLKDRPHRKIEDLAVSYGVRVGIDKHAFGEAVVDIQLLNTWGVNEDTLYKAALENLEREEPVFMNLEAAMFAELDGSVAPSFDLDIDLDKVSIPLFIFTNKFKERGASVMLSTKFMDRIVEKLGNIFILPSSIHEVIIVPKSRMDDPDQLAEMVHLVNADWVLPEDKLSDTVYEYDAENHKLVSVT